MVQAAVHAGFGMASSPYRTIPGVIENVVTAFIAAASFTVFPAILSPRPWPVGVVMFTAGLVLQVAPAAYLIITTPYLRSRAPLAVAVIAATTVGGCLGLWLIRRLQREKRP